MLTPVIPQTSNNILISAVLETVEKEILSVTVSKTASDEKMEEDL